MGEGREGREDPGRIGARRHLGAVVITPGKTGIELYFPVSRALASAFMLALFGAACGMIAAAAIAGLLRTGTSAGESMLALAFAGVFALPLALLGVLFVAVALWTAANSLTVEVDDAGLRTVRRWFGIAVAQRALKRADIAAIESRLAAKYIGVFGSTRYYRLFARTGAAYPHAMIIADSLRGTDMTAHVRDLIIEHLALPEIAPAGAQAHEDPAQ